MEAYGELRYHRTGRLFVCCAYLLGRLLSVANNWAYWAGAGGSKPNALKRQAMSGQNQQQNAPQNTPQNTGRTDIIIVGAGLVGLSLAAAIAPSGLRVSVLDKVSPADMIRPDFDGRVIAVSYASWKLFEATGVWPHMAPQAQPIMNIRVSDGDAPVFLNFDHKALGEEPHGFMVENRHIRAALLEALEGAENVSIEAPAGVKEVVQEEGSALVRLSDGSERRASLVVAADGRNSPLRDAAGIRVIRTDYNQTAIVTAIEHEKDHQGIAHERFLTPGPFAILPLPGKRSSLVWAERPEVAGAILGLDEAAFDAEIAKRIGGFLGDVHAVGPRFSYPLSLHVARRYVAGRLVVIGDAAHGIHPIAGQGVNLGWRDVAALAELVVDAHRLGLDIGAADLLAQYERWRRTDTLSLAAVTDGLTRLFSNDIKPIRLARDIGLAAVNRIPPLKRFLVRHARGTIGTLPRLLKGEAL